VPSGRHGPDHAKERLWQAYDDTAIKDQLAAEGRLKGDVCNPDYDFLDPRLDDFFRELNDVLHVSGWIHGHRALSPAINWAWNEVAILEGLFRPLDRMEGYKADLRHLTAASNAMVLGVVEEMATYHAGGVRPTFSGHQIARHAEAYAADLLAMRDSFIQRHQATLVEAPVADGLVAA
jgi:anaerobic magnesium-protoporphyrin IX monomethyl ester cyclase